MVDITIQKFGSLSGERDYKVTSTGTWYDVKTADEVIQVLETCRACSDRIRIWLGDPETGKNWLDEYDIIGTVGRSMGPVKAPLLIHNGRSMGGGAILTGSIIAIKSTAGAWRYKSPLFTLPEFTIRETVTTAPAPQSESKMGSAQADRAAAYPWEALNEAGEVHARFKSEAQAIKWRAYMRGERFAK